MSYSIKVVRDADGLRLDVHDTMLPLIPDGTWVINGHRTPDGEAGTDSLQIVAHILDDHLSASASAANRTA